MGVLVTLKMWAPVTLERALRNLSQQQLNHNPLQSD